MACTERGAAYLVLVVVVGADDVAERELLPGVVRGAGDGIPRRDGQLAWRSINTAHPHWHADRPRNRIAFPSIERRRVCCAFASIERRRGCCCLLTVTFLVAHQLRDIASRRMTAAAVSQSLSSISSPGCASSRSRP